MGKWIAATGMVASMIAGAASAAEPRARCVFVNPTFSGQCVETVEISEGSTPQKACETILDCLNDIRCSKSYCSATEIRGGWTIESATKIGPGDDSR